MGVSKNNGTPKSSILFPGFPLFSPSILGVFPLFLVQHPNERSIPTPYSEGNSQNLGASCWTSVGPYWMLIDLVEWYIQTKRQKQAGNVYLGGDGFSP